MLGLTGLPGPSTGTGFSAPPGAWSSWFASGAGGLSTNGGGGLGGATGSLGANIPAMDVPGWPGGGGPTAAGASTFALVAPADFGTAPVPSALANASAFGKEPAGGRNGGGGCRSARLPTGGGGKPGGGGGCGRGGCGRKLATGFAAIWALMVLTASSAIDSASTTCSGCPYISNIHFSGVRFTAMRAPVLCMTASTQLPFPRTWSAI